MRETFNNIPKIKYEGPKSKNPLAFRFYNPGEAIGGKTMREQLKFAMSYWHTICGEGADMFGPGTADKSFNEKSPMYLYKHKARAAFELMDKLSIDWFCFHDRDIAPESLTLAGSNARLDEMTDIIGDLMRESGKKLLWGTANLFSNPRFMHGAGTAANAEVFAFAAAQVKKALEITVRLGGTGYVFWGGREGYETLLNTDMGFEIDNMARFLKLMTAYGRKIGFKGDYYIEPKPKEPTAHQYDFDAASVLAFLRKYGLEKEIKLNIEANHATLAGHTFQHELRTARENGAFGSIDANQGNLLLGWDTDQFPSNVYETAFCMYEVIKAGGFTNGGLNFDAKNRRGSYKHEDIFKGYILGMDSFALGLRLAYKIIEDGRLDAFVENRYKSFKTGIGADIISGRATVEDLEKFALDKGDVMEFVESGGQEELEGIVNQIFFAG
ncbi:MAG: xylose isomerase [Oscillospiraceae bacterium]|nr:xylose isomerase [Oscillospiraceae bacterium]